VKREIEGYLHIELNIVCNLMESLKSNDDFLFRNYSIDFAQLLSGEKKRNKKEKSAFSFLQNHRSVFVI
jgi:hypothetical protein